MFVAGIFVGGQSHRMGGIPKGLLEAPDGERSIVEKQAALLRSLGARVYLVGSSTAYESLGIATLADEPQGIGPLGGLSALLSHAARVNALFAIALACDMPYVTAPLLERLLSHKPHESAVAPRLNGKWQPLFARYRPEEGLSATRKVRARGERALFRVLEELKTGVAELPLTREEAQLLNDWDHPEDIRASSQPTQ